MLRRRTVSKKLLLLSNMLLVCALATLMTGLIVSLIEDKENTKTIQHAKRTAATISTVKPTPQTLTDYVVAPDLPRYITIPKIQVHARVGSVGVLSSGAIGTPSNIYDTDWFNKSSKPGQAGAMLIDGHVSDWKTNGVFFNLSKLQFGDTLQIERGDGVIFTYTVAAIKIYDSQAVDMRAVLSPINPKKPGLNLITCFGDVIKGTNEFQKRIVIYSVQQN